MKSAERDSINDDIAWLKNNCISVKVIEFGTKNDILKAISDNNARIIITSGHGYENKEGIQTSDKQAFKPSDLKNQKIGDSLRTVIFENCFQGDLKKEWENAFGRNIEIVGWNGTTTTFETKSFNSFGFFDRQKLNLREYLEKSIGDIKFDIIVGDIPKAE